MRGIYAISLALAVAVLFVLFFRVWYNTATHTSSAVAVYIRGQHTVYLRHDVEYTFRQALYYGSQCYVASGFSDRGCYARYLSAWSRAWASRGVSVMLDANTVSVLADGNMLRAYLSSPIAYRGRVSGRIPPGFGVITWIGGS